MVVVNNQDQIRQAVINGQRPDLSVVTGPDQKLKKLAVSWIERCWHQDLDTRPVFSGIYCTYLCFA